MTDFDTEKFNHCLRVATQAVTSIALGGEPVDLSLESDPEFNPPVTANIVNAAVRYVSAEVDGAPLPDTSSQVAWICSSRFRAIAALASQLYECGTVPADIVRGMLDAMNRVYPLTN